MKRSVSKDLKKVKNFLVKAPVRILYRRAS